MKCLCDVLHMAFTFKIKLAGLICNMCGAYNYDVDTGSYVARCLEVVW